MKAIRMNSDKDVICFQNLERLDEAELFRMATDKLAMAGVRLSDIKELPYCDTIRGEVDSVLFDLILDANYGAEIHCKEEKAITKLVEILNN